MNKCILHSLIVFLVVLAAETTFSCSPVTPDPLSSHKPFTFKFTNMKFTPYVEALKAFASEDQIVVLGDPGFSFIYLEPITIKDHSDSAFVRYKGKDYRPIDFSNSHQYACFSRIEKPITLDSKEALNELENGGWICDEEWVNHGDSCGPYRKYGLLDNTLRFDAKTIFNIFSDPYNQEAESFVKAKLPKVIKRKISEHFIYRHKLIEFYADVEIQLRKNPIVLQLDQLNLAYCGEKCIKRGDDIYDDKITTSKLVTKAGVFVLKTKLPEYYKNDPAGYQKLLLQIKQKINQLPLNLLKFEMAADTVARNHSSDFELRQL